MQQNAKADVQLCKETNGVYIPSSIFQPVFTVTHASDYKKILLVNQKTELTSVDIDPQLGWHDTLDVNFSVTVVNFQGVPWAFKPLVKIFRGVEMVPSPNSIVGAFATGCPTMQSEAVEMCKAFSEKQPHGYAYNYNGLGILFSKALGVVEKLPTLLRSGRNMSRMIGKICDEETYESNNNQMEHLLASGFKRLMKIN
jgi:hypothetical protein